MIKIARSDKVLVLGGYETGKTTLCRNLLRASGRSLSFDPTFAFREGGQGSIPELEAAFKATNHGVLQPIDAETQFEPFCQFAIKQSNALTFIDEPAIVMDSRSQPAPNFNRLHRLGHKNGTGLMLATHHFFGDLPTFARACKHHFLFRLEESSDLDEVRKRFGQDVRDWVAHAPDYHCWYKGPGVSAPMKAPPPPPASPAPSLRVATQK